MSGNIIDKSLFFRRRMKPTDEEFRDRAGYLLLCVLNYLERFQTDEFTPEQRVRMLNGIYDSICAEFLRQEREGKAPDRNPASPEWN